MKPPLETSHPAAAASLRKMQRNPQARFLNAAAGDASAIGVEDGIEGNLLIHYVSPAGSLSLAGGWLGAGRRRYIWVPLRPTLAWNSQEQDAALLLLTAEELAVLAHDLHLGLEELGQRHVIEEFLAPAPVPPLERQAMLERYTQLLASHGWIVTVDPITSQRSLRKTEHAESTQAWSQADRDEVARLESTIAEVLRGARSTSRILYQYK